MNRRRFLNARTPHIMAGEIHRLAVVAVCDDISMVASITGRLVLEHQMMSRREVFAIVEPLRVDHPMTGTFTVNAGGCCFVSDLASVPWPFAWLVGRTGPHLRAAIVHDWMIQNCSNPDAPVGTRIEADRIFRDLMTADGVRPVRRYLIMLAVSMATIWARASTPAHAIRTLIQTGVIGVLLLPATCAVVLTRSVVDLVERCLNDVKLEPPDDR